MQVKILDVIRNEIIMYNTLLMNRYSNKYSFLTKKY